MLVLLVYKSRPRNIYITFYRVVFCVDLTQEAVQIFMRHMVELFQHLSTEAVTTRFFRKYKPKTEPTASIRNEKKKDLN